MNKTQELLLDPVKRGIPQIILPSFSLLKAQSQTS
jgi:hypothetical protein